MDLAPLPLEILVCPACSEPLRVGEEGSEFVCASAECGLAYPVYNGIPVLLVDEARRGEPPSPQGSPFRETDEGGR